MRAVDVCRDQENVGRNQGINGPEWFPAVMGMKIRQQRKARGMTQRELAQRMNFSPTTISRMESGKVNLCGQDVNQVCRELDCMLMDVWPDDSVIRNQKFENRVLIKKLQQLLEKLDYEDEE